MGWRPGAPHLRVPTNLQRSALATRGQRCWGAGGGPLSCEGPDPAPASPPRARHAQATAPGTPVPAVLRKRPVSGRGTGTLTSRDRG